LREWNKEVREKEKKEGKRRKKGKREGRSRARTTSGDEQNRFPFLSLELSLPSLLIRIIIP
jgi:hypothetical protein